MALVFARLDYAVLTSQEPTFNISRDPALHTNAKIDLGGTFSTSTLIAFLITTLIFFAQIWRAQRHERSTLSRIPRLPGLPLFGNFWAVPKFDLKCAMKAEKVHRRYGPMYESRCLGTTYVSAATWDVASDLFVQYRSGHIRREESSLAKSLRRTLHLPNPVGERSNDSYTQLYDNVGLSVREHFLQNLQHEQRDMLQSFLESPQRWAEHIVTHAARTAAHLAWGDSARGTTLVTIAPFLHAQTFNGVSRKRWPVLFGHSMPNSRITNADKLDISNGFVDAYCDVVRNCKAGLAPRSWVSDWYEQSSRGPHHSFENVSMAHTVGIRAIERMILVTSQLHSYFTAVCWYPSWQSRLQEELDRFCGCRPPTAQDLPQLPTLRAIVKETYRWRRPDPFSESYVALDDIICHGRRITKGSIVSVNLHAICHNPYLYPESQQWNPGRWLDPMSPVCKGPLSRHSAPMGDDLCDITGQPSPALGLIFNQLCVAIGAIAWACTIKRQEGRAGCETTIPSNASESFIMALSKPCQCVVSVRRERGHLYT